MSLEIKRDDVASLMKAVKSLTKTDILVGVPSEETERDDGAQINNATLAYIHENGSPAAGIPARPFLAPGIEAAKEKITDRLQRAAKAALSNDTGSANVQLNSAGLIAQNSVRGLINSGIAPALEASTLASRRRRGRTGTVPLIDTGQLRNSITYVVREKK